MWISPRARVAPSYMEPHGLYLLSCARFQEFSLTRFVSDDQADRPVLNWAIDQGLARGG